MHTKSMSENLKGRDNSEDRKDNMRMDVREIGR